MTRGLEPSFEETRELKDDVEEIAMTILLFTPSIGGKEGSGGVYALNQ